MDLEKLNAEKARQVLILVDDDGNRLGVAPRPECHTGKGRRHKAFVVMLHDSKGRFLVQRRKHPLWDDYWDVSATSHPLHVGGKDQSLEEAAENCLKRELGVTARVENLGAFNYYAEHARNACENEHCYVLVGEVKGQVKPSPLEVYEVDWKTLPELVNEVNSTYKGKEYTPWIKHTVDLLKNSSLGKKLLQ